MGRHDPDLYWVQIYHSSYPAICQLISSQVLQPYRQALSGPRNAQIWHLNPRWCIDVVSDESCLIGGAHIQAQLSHQPSHAYCAMLAASPWFAQYPGTDLLYRELRAGISDAQRFAAALESRVRQGRRVWSAPLLTNCPTTYTALWQSDRTFIARQPNGHYMLGLSYAVGYRPPRSLARHGTVGLDLGIDPLTVIRSDTGRTLFFRPTPLTHLRALPQLTPEAQQLFRNLIYASGRADAEQVVAWLNCHAHTVYAERLSHRGMTHFWIHRGRDLAIHDHHFSAASQLLFASGVTFRRVPSKDTSVTCACCLEYQGRVVYGVRSGDTFDCPQCRRTYNAHGNAAHNVLLRGQALPSSRAYSRVASRLPSPEASPRRTPLYR